MVGFEAPPRAPMLNFPGVVKQRGDERAIYEIASTFPNARS